MNERIEKLAVEARQYAFGEVENSQDRKDIKSRLGYSRIGLGNV